MPDHPRQRIEAPSSKVRTYEHTRKRLFDAIESKIGRPIDFQSKARDPRLSDCSSPNFYKWKFSPAYPAFPQSSVSRWSSEQHRLCNEALDKGYLDAEIVDPPEQEPLSNTHVCSTPKVMSSSSSPTRPGVNTHDIRVPEDPNPTSTDKSPLHQNQPRSIPGHENDDFVACVFTEMKARIERHISTKLRQEEALREEAETRGLTSASELAELRLQVALLEEQARDRDNLAAAELSEKLVAARKEGEAAGREKAIDDTHEELRTLRHSHLSHINKVREDAYAEGLRKGRELSLAESHPNSQVTAKQIEELRVEHAEMLQRTREEAKREGRDMAFKELAVGDETVDNLVNSNSELNKSRKVRELRTIFQNWHNIPQRALPSYMLPEGHTPGDKTLYLLAKLSKEVDAVRAGQLLRDEIDRRQEHLIHSIRSLVVTNADIKKVLDRISPIGDRNDAVEDLPLVAENSSITDPTATAAEPGPGCTSNGTCSRIVVTTSDSNDAAPEESHSTTESETRSTVSSQVVLQQHKSPMNEILEALDKPMLGDKFPPQMQSFSPSFFRESVGGYDTVFAKVGPAMLGKQIVPWPEIIRINPEYHELAPCLGSHGALTLVDGKANCGIIGKQYPAVLRKSKDELEYIGHYKLVDRIIVSVIQWNAWSENRRRVIAKEIAESSWGETLLMEKNLPTKGMMLEERIKEILAFFQKESEPNLRMNWTILQFISFNSADYDTLVAKFKDSQERELARPDSIFHNLWKGAKRKDDINPASSRERKRARTSINTDLDTKPRLPVNEDDDLYNATPRPERRRTMNGNIPDADLPRLGSTSGTGPPGKKLLASVERGSEILKNALQKDVTPPRIDAKFKDSIGPLNQERQAAERARSSKLVSKLPSFPNWKTVESITSDSPMLPSRFSPQDPYPTAEDMNKLLRMISHSTRTPEADWYLALSPVGFKNGETKKAARRLHDNDTINHFSTFAEWYLQRTKKVSAGVALVGLFYDYDWSTSGLAHGRRDAWISTLRDTTGGKELIAWSSRAHAIRRKLTRSIGDEYVEHHDIVDLPKMQQQLIEYLHGKCQLKSIWLGGPKLPVDWFEAGNWLLDNLCGSKLKLPNSHQLSAAGYVRVHCNSQKYASPTAIDANNDGE